MPSDEDTFRDDLRSWLAENPPPAVAGFPATPEHAKQVRDWQRTLHAGRWGGIHWPVEYGGRGASPPQIAIYNEELARAHAPDLLGGVGLSMLGPALMVYGTDEQRARWLPRILNADDIWCQLFSEPGAGSDLAGLSTRAERHGDAYLVTGQKVWSTGDQFTDWGIALVRTDTDAPKSKGISMLAVSMQAKGVDVRPLRQMAGESEFNEVFLDGVEVPIENVIGPENEGWRVANTTLANERGASFVWKEQVLLDAAVDALVEQCDSDDARVRQKLARS